MTPAAAAPEVRLLLACARRELGPNDRAALAAALAEGLDWGRVMALAEWHGLRPLLHRHLDGLEEVPGPVRIALWAEAAAIARRNRAMDAELGRVAGLLEEAGIVAVAYKGPTLAVRAYGEVGLREFGDLDLLVPRAEVLRARNLMVRKADYVREYELTDAAEKALVDSHAQYHLVVRSRGLGHLVELHWKSDPDFPVERLEDPEWMHMARGQDPRVPTLPDEDLMLVLCIHGAKHAWLSLGWLVDVAELLRAGMPIDWERLRTRALAMDAGRRVGLGFRLARDLLGAPLPPVARSLADRRDVAAVASRVLQKILRAEPRPLETLGELPLQWRLHERTGTRIGMVFRALCAPSLVEWTRWRLPRSLFFAYPVLRAGRLAAKYLRKGLKITFRGRRLQA